MKLSAWITTDKSVVGDGPFDVEVLDTDTGGVAECHFSAQGEQSADSAPGDIQQEATEILRQSSWYLTGEWEHAGPGFIAPVEKR